VAAGGAVSYQQQPCEGGAQGGLLHFHPFVAHFRGALAAGRAGRRGVF